LFWGVYAGLVIGLLIAELRENRLAQIILKPLAALGFVIIAYKFGALFSDYGRLVFVGLVFCAVGDVFLLSRARIVVFFKLGMLAFAIGHILYIFAASEILRAEMTPLFLIATTLLGLGFGLIVFLKLKPNPPRDMVWAVGIYTVVISLMLIRALQTNMTGSHLLILPAAILFAVSDIFVARDRFVAPTPKNAFLITPLYFGAQALFALSVV